MVHTRKFIWLNIVNIDKTTEVRRESCMELVFEARTHETHTWRACEECGMRKQ